MVAACEVDFGKYCCTCQVCVDILDVRERVAVIHCRVVEAAEITARTPASSRFWDNVQRRSPGRAGTADYAQLFHPCELSLGRGEFSCVEAAGACMEWGANCDDVVFYSMFVAVGRLEAGNEELRKVGDDTVKVVYRRRVDARD